MRRHAWSRLAAGVRICRRCGCRRWKVPGSARWRYVDSRLVGWTLDRPACITTKEKGAR
jgi:hypothetical protein